MMHYIFFKIRNIRNLIIISFVFLLGFCYINSYRFPYVANFEHIIFIISDKLNISTFFTLATLLITRSFFRIDKWEIQCILRQNVRKWFVENLLLIIMTILIFIISFVLLQSLFNFFRRMTFSLRWEDTYSVHNEVTLIDGFDKTGFPLNYLYELNISPIICIVLALLLLFARCLFYCLIAVVFLKYTNSYRISIPLTIILNYLDVFFYDIVATNKILLLPIEHSVVTYVNYSRLSLNISIIYWIILIICFSLIIYILIQKDIERKMLLTKK